MKKRQLYYSYILLGLLVIILVIGVDILLSSHSSKRQQFQSSPTPAIASTPIIHSKLQIVSTDPTNQQTNVPINQIVSIVFNQSVDSQNISFTIQPAVVYATNSANNSFTVYFSNSLQPSTLYTYQIRLKNRQLGTYTFDTAGADSAVNNDNAAQALSDWSRTSRPDMFLYRDTPYQTLDFSITSDISQVSGEAEFNVVITASDANQGKQAFLNWLNSLGLTNAQIQNLTIHYQSPGGGP